MNRIHVLLADDHETVRQGLKLLIDGQADMQVVDEAGDGRTLVERARALRPHVVVLDISMPEMNGLSATRQLKAETGEIAVVVLTRHSDNAYVQELLSAGATGYVLKQSPSTELLEAIRAAAGGRRYVDSSLPHRPVVARSVSGPTKPRITERESEVLRLTALGHSNKEIASSLELSVKTVEVHKANAMRKLGLHGRIDIVRLAVLHGWLQDA